LYLSGLEEDRLEELPPPEEPPEEEDLLEEDFDDDEEELDFFFESARLALEAALPVLPLYAIFVYNYTIIIPPTLLLKYI